MSHTPQRKEKDCLNCGATVQGRYCHICGQENVEPKETFWHMVTHFFNDITHFDGSFFTSVEDLLFKPGFLSKEYMKGRRARYLHPVRMYVFTSAIFFLLFFSVFKSNVVQTNLDDPLSKEERMELIEKTKQKSIKDPGNIAFIKQLELLADSSREITMQEYRQFSNTNVITINGNKYQSLAEYDSVQKNLPSTERDGWLKRLFIRKTLAINDKYRGNPMEALDKLNETFLHRLPYMLFVSLPLFALILKWVYSRRKWRKEFYFADHGVFTIHLYIFSFLVLLLVFGFDKLHNITGWDFFRYILIILIIGQFLYLYKAMRYFYGQGRGKTFLKFLLVSLFALVMICFLFFCFLLFSAITL